MEDLAGSLAKADWQPCGQASFTCNSIDLQKQLGDYVPSRLKDYKLSAWKKLVGFTRIDSPEGFLIPVAISAGEPHISDGTTSTKLVANEPVRFQVGYIISGSLYYIIALPPPAAA